jgi:hypothetical protein
MFIQNNKKGYLVVLALVFGAVFLTIIGSFLSYVITQHTEQKHQYTKERALSVAEAGLNYYKWFLAHNPDDTTNGTGLSGPYVGVYEDPEGGPIGEFSLEIASSSACGDTYAIDISSTGVTYENPDVGRKVYARYARPTIAEYSYIINSNVWAGADRTIIGPYHSNGAVRMDGTNNSVVTSGQENWVCDGSMSCAPGANGSTVDGVFGNGPNKNLWTFPSTPINFTGITVDLASMQDKAQNHGGRYFGPSGRQGYHVIFKSNGTFDVRRVNSKENEPNGYAWGRYLHILKGTTLIGNYPIPSGCSVLYFEDQVWMEGVINGKVTVAVADVDTPGRDPSLILNNNITYANEDSGLLAIGEYDVLIPLVVPDNMILNGIFVAQNGHFGRNHYDTSMPNSWESNIKRNSLTLNGTIVSNGREGTKWVSNTGVYTSGFNTRYNSYDRDLVADPPPLTPEVSDTYEFIEWREDNG